MFDTELYDPDMAGFETGQSYIYVAGRGIFPVTYTVCGEFAVMEGDIVLGDLDTMRRMDKLVSGYRNLADNESARNDINVKACAINTIGDWWPKAAIFYKIESAWKMDPINAAIEYINKYTPVTLIKMTSEPNYVSFVHSTGCSSRVGMVGGKQEINIADWATMGNVAHEVFHAAGLWHEHSRTDRDKYVTVNLGNLANPGAVHNFDIRSNSTNLSRYDYGSIMHYPESAFAIAGKKTIIPKDPSAVIGQRDGASECDKMALAHMYLNK